jgi:hypothetical protein
MTTRTSLQTLVLLMASIVVPLSVHAAPVASDEIITDTNAARSANGIAPLVADPVLSQIAQQRVDNMFAEQYFGHVSPEGIGADDIAQTLGYDYFLLAENIAAGDLADSTTIVNGWMNSPGHRANILNASLVNIGVAAKEGTFKGKNNQWVVVQVFSRPKSHCSFPDSRLFSKLQSEKLFAARIGSFLTQQQGLSLGTTLLDTTVQTLLTQLAAAYTDFVKVLNTQIQAYNTDVSVYAVCAQGAA